MVLISLIHLSVKCGLSRVLSIRFSALYLISIKKPHPGHPIRKTYVGNFVNFGTFILKGKKSRPGINFKTKEKKIINARNVILFKPSKEFKDFINLNDEKI